MAQKSHTSAIFSSKVLSIARNSCTPGPAGKRGLGGSAAGGAAAGGGAVVTLGVGRVLGLGSTAVLVLRDGVRSLIDAASSGGGGAGGCAALGGVVVGVHGELARAAEGGSRRGPLATVDEAGPEKAVACAAVGGGATAGCGSDGVDFPLRAFSA